MQHFGSFNFALLECNHDPSQSNCTFFFFQEIASLKSITKTLERNFCRHYYGVFIVDPEKVWLVQAQPF